jgi:heptosyltransferase III
MSETLTAARRILVLKPDEIGDFVLATPMLRALRAAAPQAFIALVVAAAALPLTENCPHIDAAVTPAGDTAAGKFSFRGRTSADVAAFAAAFRDGFDIVINARFDYDKGGAATLAAATKAPLRLAYAENVTPWKADSNRGFDGAYTRTLGAYGPAHEVTRGLDLVAALGGAIPTDPKVEVYLRPQEIAAARARLAQAFPGGRPRRLLALAPTTACLRRNYPVGMFGELLARVAATNGFGGVVLLGTADGAARAAALAGEAGRPVLDLTGQTGVREAAALIAGCDALLAADSGPAHLAAAVGVPVAALFCHPVGGDPMGPHAPERFRPWGRDVLAVQPPRPKPPCSDKCLSIEAHCITGIDPAQAAAAISAFYRQAGVK